MPQNFLIMPATGSDQADEWVRLGVDAQVSNNLPMAQQRYSQALRLDPRHAVAMQNLAIVFAQSSLLNEALLTIERASMCDGVHSAIRTNWALMALESDRIDEALTAARKAVELDPKDVHALFALAMVCATAGLPEEAVPVYNRILDIDPKHSAAGANSCFVQTLTNCGPADLLKQRQRWYQANKYEGKIEPHKNDRDPDRVLRVGYVSGDYKSHSASFIFRRVLLHHGPEIQMYLYSTLPVNGQADAATYKFQTAVGVGSPELPPNKDRRWRDISTMSDDDAAALIRRDKIDILVDLAAHTNGGRLPIFLRKPAPIQVTAWGFAHGTGLDGVMDVFFADPIAIPQEERQHYAERIVDLPCIVTMEAPTEYQLKATSTPPIKKNGYLTFGAYARYEKMSNECLRAYGEILRRVPDSRLEFKDNAMRRPYSLRRVMKAMPDISPERLLFSTATSHPDHLLAMQQCDLALDTAPHGGGVVTLETLFMGVPLVTKYGTQAAGRTAASVLTAMGRKEWVTYTTEEYVEKAVAMAEDTKMLADARKTLRQELLDSPVCAGYVEKVESAYKMLWKEWCNQ